MTGAQIERLRGQQRLKRLSQLSPADAQQWSLTLSNLDLSKDSIKVAMGFAMDRVDCAEQLVAMVLQMVVVNAPAVKVAGLYLLSDLAHNAGAPVKHASNFRSAVQDAAPLALSDLCTAKRRAPGRLTALQIEDRVKGLLGVWAEWSVFPVGFLVGLQAQFYATEGQVRRMEGAVKEARRRRGGGKGEEGQGGGEEEGAEALSHFPRLLELVEGGDSGDSGDKDTLVSLRREARAAAVPLWATASTEVLLAGLDFVAHYSTAAFGSSLPAISNLLGGSGGGSGA
ncbi:hypothetical protein B484DRAFT_389609 [Ochromonadaceae sp. CCMP2298]|nr:hypothetical protein B484DRAFT_389609 [Ochromonadaceae sp. CCMP2298]